jgi:hypothetical protein
MPQQNLHAETLFTIIAAQARCMMIAEQIPNTEQFKLRLEVVKTDTHLNNLMPVTIGVVTQTYWEHAGYKVPKWTKTLQTLREAGIVKDGKKGKILNRGLTMMFVGYSEDHAENVFQLFNPETSRIAQSCNVIWLGRMYHTRQDADLTQQLPIVTVPINIHNASVDAEIQKLEVATFPLSEERGVDSNSSSDNADEWIMANTRYGCAIERKDGSYNPGTGSINKWSDVVAAEVDYIENLVANYYKVLEINESEVKVLQMLNDSISEYINIGAGVSGGFTNTNELHMMKYHEAINGPDGKNGKLKSKQNMRE